MGLQFLVPPVQMQLGDARIVRHHSSKHKECKRVSQAADLKLRCILRVPQAQGGYSGLQVTGMIEGFFGV